MLVTTVTSDAALKTMEELVEEVMAAAAAGPGDGGDENGKCQHTIHSSQPSRVIDRVLESHSRFPHHQTDDLTALYFSIGLLNRGRDIIAQCFEAQDEDAASSTAAVQDNPEENAPKRQRIEPKLGGCPRCLRASEAAKRYPLPLRLFHGPITPTTTDVWCGNALLPSFFGNENDMTPVLLPTESFRLRLCDASQPLPTAYLPPTSSLQVLGITSFPLLSLDEMATTPMFSVEAISTTKTPFHTLLETAVGAGHIANPASSNVIVRFLQHRGPLAQEEPSLTRAAADPRLFVVRGDIHVKQEGAAIVGKLVLQELYSSAEAVSCSGWRGLRYNGPIILGTERELEDDTARPSFEEFYGAFGMSNELEATKEALSNAFRGLQQLGSTSPGNLHSQTARAAATPPRSTLPRARSLDPTEPSSQGDSMAAFSESGDWEGSQYSDFMGEDEEARRRQKEARKSLKSIYRTLETSKSHEEALSALGFQGVGPQGSEALWWSHFTGMIHLPSATADVQVLEQVEPTAWKTVDFPGSSDAATTLGVLHHYSNPSQPQAGAVTENVTHENCSPVFPCFDDLASAKRFLDPLLWYHTQLQDNTAQHKLHWGTLDTSGTLAHHDAQGRIGPEKPIAPSYGTGLKASFVATELLLRWNARGPSIVGCIGQPTRFWWRTVIRRRRRRLMGVTSVIPEGATASSAAAPSGSQGGPSVDVLKRLASTKKQVTKQYVLLLLLDHHAPTLLLLLLLLHLLLLATARVKRHSRNTKLRHQALPPRRERRGMSFPDSDGLGGEERSDGASTKETTELSGGDTSETGRPSRARSTHQLRSELLSMFAGDGSVIDSIRAHRVPLRIRNEPRRPGPSNESPDPLFFNYEQCSAAEDTNGTVCVTMLPNVLVHSIHY